MLGRRRLHRLFVWEQMAADPHVFALHRTTGKRKGKTQDTKTVLVFKLDKGVVADVTEFQSDYPTVAQFCKVHTGSRLARVRRAHAAIMSAAVKNEKLMAAMWPRSRGRLQWEMRESETCEWYNDGGRKTGLDRADELR